MSDENLRTIFSIECDDSNGGYRIHIEEGTTSDEVLFGVNALIKIFVREKFYKDEEEVYKLLKHFSTDPQYQELKEEDNAEHTDTGDKPASDN